MLFLPVGGQAGRSIRTGRVNDTVVDNDRPSGVVFTGEFPSLICVLDGLGGHPAGDIASSLAAEVIASGSSGVETEQDVISLVVDANRFLYEAMLSYRGLRDMGTTIAGAFVTAGKVVVFHVGGCTFTPAAA